MRPLTFDEKCERFPPVLVRLLARTVLANGEAEAWTDEKIAKRSGLSIKKVADLSRLTNWETVDAPTRRAFLEGCGADFDSRRWLQRNTQYIETIQSVPRYLRKSRDWTRVFEPLCVLWIQCEQAKAA